MKMINENVEMKVKCRPECSKKVNDMRNFKKVDIKKEVFFIGKGYFVPTPFS